MLIDLLVVAILVFLAVRGRTTGTITQVGQWAGLMLGRAVAKPLALILTLMLLKDLGFPAASIRVFISGLCFYTFYILGSMIARHFLKRSIGHHTNSRKDQVGGMLLGVAKGVVAIHFTLSVVLFFERPIAKALEISLDRSLVVAFVRPRNVFATASRPTLTRLNKLLEATRDPEAAKQLADDPALAAMLDDPAVLAALTDERLGAAVEKRDWAILQEDPRVSALLRDPRITGPLTDPLDADGDPETDQK
jgi:membrane protein required for colicin V production